MQKAPLTKYDAYIHCTEINAGTAAGCMTRSGVGGERARGMSRCKTKEMKAADCCV